MMHEGKTDCRPRDAGYNPRALDTLDAVCHDLIDTGIISAACYLLARRGKVFAHKSTGKLTRAADSPDFLPDSLRPVASLTKAFTAAGIWQLMEQGKIHLTQQVSTILKEFDTPMHRDINIFQLLTHTSGLKADPDGYLEPYPEDWGGDKIDKDNWIKFQLSGPLQFRPGSTWNYASKGYMFLAEIIARVSGVEYDRYVEENIWKPLGMTDSHFFLPENKRARTGSVSDWNKRKIGLKREEQVVISSLGSGGAFCSAHDMYVFGQMLLNKGTFDGTRVLGRKTVEAAVRAQIRDMVSYNWQGDMFAGDKRVTYGLGLEMNKHTFTSEGTFDHEGAGGVFLFMDPQEDFLFAGFMTSPEWHGESWIRPLAAAWAGIE